MKLRTLIHPLLMIAVLAVACSAYGAWYARVGKESAIAVELAKQIQEAKQNSTRAEEARRELERATADEAAIQGYFVSTADVVSFLESLQGIGSRLGTKVTVVSVSSVPSKPHAQLQLSLTIAGSFDAVGRTLGAIEYQPYDTVIQNLTLDTPVGEATAGKKAQWTAAVTMLVGTIDTPITRPSSPAPTLVATTSASTTQP
jgi:hypothetical protein